MVDKPVLDYKIELYFDEEKNHKFNRRMELSEYVHAIDTFYKLAASTKELTGNFVLLLEGKGVMMTLTKEFK